MKAGHTGKAGMNRKPADTKHHMLESYTGRTMIILR